MFLTFVPRGNMIAANEQQAAALKNILDQGHQLASHTFMHEDLNTLSEAAMQQTMTSTADIMFQHSGIRPRYMRAPFGNCGDVCLNVMTRLGYLVTHWNVDTDDWRYITEPSAETAVEKSMANINKIIVQESDPSKDSFIILQHEIHQFSVELLVDKVIDAVLEKGYRFVSIEECVGEAAYLDGAIEPNNPDGPTGPTTTVGSDGSIITINPDAPAGLVTTVDSEGSIITVNPDAPTATVGPGDSPITVNATTTIPSLGNLTTLTTPTRSRTSMPTATSTETGTSGANTVQSAVWAMGLSAIISFILL
ncbi:chitin deacetylase [Mortierella sp. NVP85]|nr:chitin deacetylase [Mortierella sp. NVP85]